eukprot:CAMPEP_0183486868 /NCGR_PEP_ID=MMETSP0370-20130417/180153_1 /TAXON_ID=268820 /ORGANISM="Peridinium aciculiferum, Strain PAER-2" /LENGTH=612 /DNA_ID=CAMNT_0025680187 /DNA_START=126 /DNA_END=1962 /DNA_ORIENTATION=-
MGDQEEVLEKKGAELFREVLRIYPGASVEDYFANGIWKDDVMSVDWQLITAHRAEGGAEDPPALEDVKMPELPKKPAFLPTMGAMLPAGIKPMMMATPGALRPAGMAFAPGVLRPQITPTVMGIRPASAQPAGIRLLTSGPKAVGAAVAARLGSALPKAVGAPVAARLGSALPKAMGAPKAVARPGFAAPKAGALGGAAAATGPAVAARLGSALPKAVGAPVAARLGSALPKAMGAPKAVARPGFAAPKAGALGGAAAATGPVAELRQIALFVAKWKLDPTRTKMMLAKLGPARRRYVIQTFKHTAYGADVTAGLQQYIAQCERTDAWAGATATATSAAAAGMGIKRTFATSSAMSSSAAKMPRVMTAVPKAGAGAPTSLAARIAAQRAQSLGARPASATGSATSLMAARMAAQRSMQVRAASAGTATSMLAARIAAQRSMAARPASAGAVRPGVAGGMRPTSTMGIRPTGAMTMYGGVARGGMAPKASAVRPQGSVSAGWGSGGQQQQWAGRPATSSLLGVGGPRAKAPAPKAGAKPGSLIRNLLKGIEAAAVARPDFERRPPHVFGASCSGSWLRSAGDWRRSGPSSVRGASAWDGVLIGDLTVVREEKK